MKKVINKWVRMILNWIVMKPENQNNNKISIDEISKYIKQNEDIFESDVLDVWNAKIVFF